MPLVVVTYDPNQVKDQAELIAKLSSPLAEKLAAALDPDHLSGDDIEVLFRQYMPFDKSNHFAVAIDVTASETPIRLQILKNVTETITAWSKKALLGILSEGSKVYVWIKLTPAHFVEFET